MALLLPNDEGPDDFGVDLVSVFQSYVSSIDPTNVSEKVLVRGSQNVYKKISGTLANRPGRKLYDATEDSTIAKCNSGYVWNTSLGAVIPIRCANGKLQFYSTVSGTGVWYDLLTSLTLTRFVFAPWWDNTDKKSKLLMVNGDTAKVYDWSGGVALFVSYVGNVITLDRNAATAGFAASGTVVINGIDYTYTGISGSTLTGTSDASAAVLNQVVQAKIVTVTSFSSGPGTTYVCDYIRVVSNQLHLGSYTSQLHFISKNTSYSDFGHSTPRLTGEGDTVILDASGKGIGVRDNTAHVFYGDSHLAIISFNQITVGSTLSEQTLVEKVPLGGNCAAYAHEFIDSLANNVVYLDQAQQLRAYGAFRNLFESKAVLLSQSVQDELAEEDFTLGQLAVESDRRGDVVYITAPNSGRTHIYLERNGLDSQGNVTSERYWQPPQLWNLTRIDAISGRTIGFSNSNPQLYYLWDTGQWYDDSPSGQLPYQSIALFSYKNGGRRQGKLNFDKIYWEGYLTLNSHLYGGVYFDYQGSTSLLSPIINDPDSPLTDKMIFTGVSPPSLGDASLGDSPLGDGVNTQPDDQALLPKFRVITSVPQIDCFEYSLMIYSTNAGARWELLALGTNAALSIAQAVEIVK